MFVICAGFRFYVTYFLDSVPIAVSWPSKNGYYYFSFFLPRIFEFSFGMALGYLHYFKGSVLAYLSRVRFFALGALMAYTGYVFLMYRWGWVFSDLLMGVGLFPMLLGLANLIAKNKWGEIVLKKIGALSYPIYLLHHYFLNYALLPLLIVLGLAGNETVFWLMLIPYFILSVGSGQAGEWVERGWLLLFVSLKMVLTPKAVGSEMKPELKSPGRYPPQSKGS
jgi:peptidoglycan/LPS O-acetylase OafA/YrhL